MNRRFLRSEHSIEDITHYAEPTSGRRRLRLGGASGNDSRDQRPRLIGYCPATEADRWAHFRKSLGGLLTVLAGFYASLALLIALITAVGSH